MRHNFLTKFNLNNLD